MKPKSPALAILLVDDDAMVRSIVSEYLENIGFNNVYAAIDGKEAKKIIENEEYAIDLIISDWEMPEVSGLALLKAVRSSENRGPTPFIMVTSQRSMERFKISQAAQWQVNAYILKPFRQNDLRKKIWEVMEWDEEEAAS